MSAATEQARSLLTAHFTDEYVGYVCRSGLLSVLAGEVESLTAALRLLYDDFTRMPDADLYDGDPRWQWWINTAASRDNAREVLAALAVVGHPQEEK